MTTPIKYRISSTATKPVSDTVKGAPLTSLEIDGNFRSIKDSIELIQSAYLPAGYSAPVEYVAGVILSSAAQTVAYQGEVYAPKAADVPFTTSGVFEVTKFVQIQSVAGVDLAATDGAAKIGYDGGSVQDVLDAVTGPTGAASVGYTPVGAGAVATTVEHAMQRGFASIFSFMSEAQIQDILSGAGTMESAAAMQEALDKYAGRFIYIPSGVYLISTRLFPKSNTVLWMEGGVTIKRTAANTGILRLINVDNVHIYANGALFDATEINAGASSAVYFESSRNCSLHNARVNGGQWSGGAPAIGTWSGGSKDCVYIGEGAFGPCRNIEILGGIMSNANRNGISVASAVGTIIDGVECYGANAAPGAGIDVEANFYDDVSNTLIQNCEIHNNKQSGIVNVFGCNTTIRKNRVYNNGAYGIATSAGGTQFDTGVYRSNIDVRGVSAFDTATGRISVGGDLNLLPIGTVVIFRRLNGATTPAELTTIRYTVAAHVAGSTTDILLGLAVDYGVITSFSGTGSGALNADPALSDIQLLCYVDGQSSDILIEENTVYGNVSPGIYLSTAVKQYANNNTVFDNSNTQIQALYCKDVEICNNSVKQSIATSNIVGISASQVADAKIKNNNVYNVGGRGIDLTTCSYAISNDNTVMNCGALGSGTGGTSLIRLQQSVGMQVVGNILRNSEDYPAAATNYGIYAPSTLTNSIFERNDCRNTGNSDANSISILSSTNIVNNSTIKSGILYGTGSATYDPASLADGAGVTTTVSCQGAVLGDYATASFSLNLQGITLTAYVSSSNVVSVRFQNETGGTVDLASGTIRVRVVRTF